MGRNSFSFEFSKKEDKITASALVVRCFFFLFEFSRLNFLITNMLTYICMYVCKYICVCVCANFLNFF